MPLRGRPFRSGALGVLAGGLAVLGVAACGGKDASSDGSAAGSGPGDPARGRSVYFAACIVCHNPDPTKDGPVGPAVAGASRELLEARILNAAYPSGYTPKRPTALMPKQPQLAADIPHLAAFLAR